MTASLLPILPPAPGANHAPDAVLPGGEPVTPENDGPEAQPPAAPVSAKGPSRYRRLKGNELVNPGDFVGGGHRKLELWDGPSGFRADAFIKPIFRRSETRPPEGKKTK